jgi:hypothetical protein
MWPFGRGDRLDEYAELSALPSTLHEAEGAPMTGRVEHLHTQVWTASKAASAHRGKVVISAESLVVLIGKRMHMHAAFASSDQAPLLISFTAEGLRRDLDAALALPPAGKDKGGRGTAQLDIRTTIPAAVPAQLSSHQLRATAPEADVLSMCRWA